MAFRVAAAQCKKICPERLNWPSRYLWRPPWNFKIIFSRPLFIIISSQKWCQISVRFFCALPGTKNLQWPVSPSHSDLLGKSNRMSKCSQRCRLLPKKEAHLSADQYNPIQSRILKQLVSKMWDFDLPTFGSNLDMAQQARWAKFKAELIAGQSKLTP